MPDKDKTKAQLMDQLAELRARVTQLEASEPKYRDLYDNAPDMFVSIDPDTATLVACNKTALSKLGYSRDELIGRSIFDLYHPDCLEAVARAFQSFKQTGEVRDALLQLRCRDGSTIDVTLNATAVRDTDGKILHSRSIWRDVTGNARAERELRQEKEGLERRVAEGTHELSEANAALRQQMADRKEAEEALRHAQKMEAMGQLMGGLAHDFNNLLTVIQTNAALIADDLPAETDQVRAELRDVQDAARQGAALIDKLLSFSRRDTLSVKPLDVSALIERTCGVIRRLLPATIEIRWSDNEQHLAVEGDSDAIEQILMNLSNNARDAMPKGGVLRVEAATTSLDEQACQRFGGGEPGEYVRLAVSDTGVGMDKATKDKIFEPFFTTKPAGQGTGLGLSIIRGLVREQNGFIDVESEVGEGTKVSVYLPSAAQPQEAAPAEVVEEKPQGGAETILLIEDEEALRRAGKRVLERYGYSVLLGVDGEDGLRVYHDNKADVALVITDVVMPKKSGPEVCDLIKKETQSVKFIYTSGYSANDVSSDVPMDPTIPFVSKPWALSALVALVREVLDQAPHN